MTLPFDKNISQLFAGTDLVIGRRHDVRKPDCLLRQAMGEAVKIRGSHGLTC